MAQLLDLGLECRRGGGRGVDLGLQALDVVVELVAVPRGNVFGFDAAWQRAGVMQVLPNVGKGGMGTAKFHLISRTRERIPKHACVVTPRAPPTLAPLLLPERPCVFFISESQ